MSLQQTSRPVARVWMAMVALGAWFTIATPLALHGLKAHKQGRATPPTAAEVRARLALLPADARRTPTVARLEAVLAADPAFADAEFTWNHVVAGTLTEAERTQGLALADLTSPTPPPPTEAPEADADLVSVARAILEVYGYDEAPDAEVPQLDPWPGTDRRTRARAVVALVRGPGIDPRAARTILHATLTLLRAQLDRAENMHTMEELLPIAMGQAR